ncbi:MAG: hypothetical protein COB08_014065 [Rhodobacteraceae bacterium]|nr:hypothetical protein [Paracoccaceae bacterium]
MGSGKSFFLKCWVGAHQKENEGTAKTVYFDAFAHDYLDDPLVAIIGTIAGRFEPDDISSKALTKAKTATAKLWRPALRIGFATATAGLSEITGVAVNSALDAGSTELKKTSEDFWKKEDGKRAAMEEFRKAIFALTEPSEEGESPNKLVIVIDGLDRCRPDYALALLEIIKHFFAVPNVHFVLGVNLAELQNSVKARYGQGVDAGIYLQKFITITMGLPKLTEPDHGKLIELDYYSNMAAEMELNEALVAEVSYYLERILPHDLLSIRGMQKLLTQVALTPQDPHLFETHPIAYKVIIAGLIVLKVAFPDEYKKARTNEISMSDIISCFNTNAQNETWRNNYNEIIDNFWRTVLSLETLKRDTNTRHAEIREYWGGGAPTSEFVSGVIADYLEYFKFPGEAG